MFRMNDGADRLSDPGVRLQAPVGGREIDDADLSLALDNCLHDAVGPGDFQRKRQIGKAPTKLLKRSSEQVSDIAFAGDEFDMATLESLQVREFRQRILAGGVLNTGVLDQQLAGLRCPDAAAIPLQQRRRYLLFQ